jgi:hypothetical protein
MSCLCWKFSLQIDELPLVSPLHLQLQVLLLLLLLWVTFLLHYGG